MVLRILLSTCTLPLPKVSTKVLKDQTVEVSATRSIAIEGRVHTIQLTKPPGRLSRSSHAVPRFVNAVERTTSSYVILGDYFEILSLQDHSFRITVEKLREN